MKKTFLFLAFPFLMIVSNAQSVDQKQTVSPAIGSPATQVSAPAQTLGGSVAQIAPTLETTIIADANENQAATPDNEEKKAVNPSIPEKKDE